MRHRQRQVQYNQRHGFTLVEMLVAATIAALLAAIGLVSYTTANRNARDARRKADLEQVRAALELYRSDNPQYPEGDFNSVIGTLYSQEYLSSGDISDPKEGQNYVYTTNPGSGACSGRTYALCATLEKDDSSYCLCNP